MKIVVIGAGVAGLSIGWRLMQAGAEVTILERAQAARGATWASAGMMAATGEIEENGTPQAQFGRRSAKLWPHFAHEAEEASGVDVEYRVDGTLILAREDDEAVALQRRAKGSATLEFIGRDAVRAREPLLAGDICGALF